MADNSSGAAGERYAADYLKGAGYRIAAKNFSCRLGEVDIICENDRYIVFAEVKTRRDTGHGEAREFVTSAKQRRVIKAAQYYLVSHPSERQPRFDVIEVYLPAGKGHVINHIEDAFELN